jgi:hypothetical protein
MRLKVYYDWELITDPKSSLIQTLFAIFPTPPISLIRGKLLAT